MAFKMKGFTYGAGTGGAKKSKTAVFQEKKKVTTYREAYADADKSKYTTYEEFEKAAKAYNTKKYGTTEPSKAVKEINKVTGGSATKEDLAKAKTKVDKMKPEDRQIKVKPTTLSGAEAKKPMSTPPKASEVKPKSKRKQRLEKRAEKLEEKGKKATGRRKYRLAKRQEKVEEKASSMKNYKKGYYKK